MRRAIIVIGSSYGDEGKGLAAALSAKRAGAKKVLTAAALTYVAALATTLMQLLRFLIILSDRRR